MKIDSKIWFLLCGFILLSCQQKKFESKEELIDYLSNPENGYFFKKSVNGYDFSLMYRPTDLLVEQELGNKTTTQVTVDSLREKYNKYLYFNLSMSRNNQELLSTAPKNRNEFGAMVNQLAFGMGNKVHLFTASKDTIPLADYIYPRLYGMGNATTMMFVYPRDKKITNTDFLNFTVEDLGLYTGEVKFKIDRKKIYKQPTIKLNTK